MQFERIPHIGATDLFRYATNSVNATLARTWTASNGDNAFFSVDGTNIWSRFNTDPSGDLGDFWGVVYDPDTYLPVYWSPVGVTPHAEVQDAFATPGYFSYPTNFTYYPTTNYYYEVTSPDLGTNEFTMLDIIGWTLISHAPPPRLTVTMSGAQQMTLSWPAGDTGFTLQERTNLTSGSWIASASGATNPAVIADSGTQKYYRLYQAPTPTTKQAGVMKFQHSTTKAPVIRIIKGWQPRSY